MRRVIVDGVVHFDNRHSMTVTLCGHSKVFGSLIGENVNESKETTEPVDCPECSRLYCEIKNAPWNEVKSDCLTHGIFSAVSK